MLILLPVLLFAVGACTGDPPRTDQTELDQSTSQSSVGSAVETSADAVVVACDEIVDVFLSELQQVVDNALAQRQDFEEGYNQIDINGEGDCSPSPEDQERLAAGVQEMAGQVIERTDISEDGEIDPVVRDVLEQLTIVGAVLTVTAPPSDPTALPNSIEPPIAPSPSNN